MRVPTAIFLYFLKNRFFCTICHKTYQIRTQLGVVNPLCSFGKTSLHSGQKMRMNVSSMLSGARNSYDAELWLRCGLVVKNDPAAAAKGISN